jgi:hypothetical protein
MTIPVWPRSDKVAHNDTRAREIVRMWLPLAKCGHAHAQYILGRAYLTGTGIGQNPQKAFLWLSKAALAHDLEAQLYLGLLYLKGVGVEKNEYSAAHWLRQSADAGVIRAQCYLSRMYAAGIGMPRSFIYAYMWALLAASGGRRELVENHGTENVRNYVLTTLETYASAMRREETAAAIRMAKKWRQRFLPAHPAKKIA